MRSMKLSVIVLLISALILPLGCATTRFEAAQAGPAPADCAVQVEVVQAEADAATLCVDLRVSARASGEVAVRAEDLVLALANGGRVRPLPGWPAERPEVVPMLRALSAARGASAGLAGGVVGELGLSAAGGDEVEQTLANEQASAFPARVVVAGQPVGGVVCFALPEPQAAEAAVEFQPEGAAPADRCATSLRPMR